MIRFLKNILVRFIFPQIEETRTHMNPIRPSHIFNYILNQKILRKNKFLYWPVHPNSVITYPENIKLGIDTSPGYAHGCYIQGKGSIEIGDYSSFACNVGIISANHDLLNPSIHVKGKVVIGKYCLVSMGSVILPGTKLGDHVIVRPNSVVDGDFSDGYCVLSGNPAKTVFKFPDEIRDRFVKPNHAQKYIGFKKVK